MHMDHKLGSIEVGKYADLVVLEKNLFDIPLTEIHLSLIHILDIGNTGNVVLDRTFSEEGMNEKFYSLLRASYLERPEELSGI